jgi:hypothetical protein
MKKYLIIAFSTLVVLLGLTYITGILPVALGNISVIPVHTGCQSSSATTSPIYMYPAAATSTLTCDAYTIDSKAISGYALDSAVLAIQYHASSTDRATLNWYYEYSQDGKDYYPENQFLNENATTTFTNSVMALTGVASKLHSFAQIATSTSFSPDGYATSSAALKMVDVKTPTRYVRVKFFPQSGTGTTSGAVWAEFIPKRQTR